MISFASPNLPSQIQKGWVMAWESLGAGVVPGRRCGPPDRITGDINMAAETSTGCAHGAQPKKWKQVK